MFASIVKKENTIMDIDFEKEDINVIELKHEIGTEKKNKFDPSKYQHIMKNKDKNFNNLNKNIINPFLMEMDTTFNYPFDKQDKNHTTKENDQIVLKYTKGTKIYYDF